MIVSKFTSGIQHEIALIHLSWTMLSEQERHLNVGWVHAYLIMVPNYDLQRVQLAWMFGGVFMSEQCSLRSDGRNTP